MVELALKLKYKIGDTVYVYIKANDSYQVVDGIVTGYGHNSKKGTVQVRVNGVRVFIDPKDIRS